MKFSHLTNVEGNIERAYKMAKFKNLRQLTMLLLCNAIQSKMSSHGQCNKLTYLISDLQNHKYFLFNIS